MAVVSHGPGQCLGKAAKYTQTGQTSLKISKSQCVVCGGTKHLLKIIHQNKRNSLKGNAVYFKKFSSGIFLLLKFQ